jgi:hypothetical protein
MKHIILAIVIHLTITFSALSQKITDPPPPHDDSTHFSITVAGTLVDRDYYVYKRVDTGQAGCDTIRVTQGRFDHKY